MTVDQEWKWDQVCGFPACDRRIDEVPLSFRAKRDSWKHSIHSRFVTLYIESFEPILRPASMPITALLSNGVLKFWFDFIASCLRMSQIWVPIPSRHSNFHYKKTVVSSTILAHTCLSEIWMFSNLGSPECVLLRDLHLLLTPNDV